MGRIEAPDPLPPRWASPAGSALDRVRDELLAMDAKDLAVMNVDVTSAAMTVLGVVEDLPRYRPGLVALFGEERVGKLDRLELLAVATLEAHGRYRGLDTGVQLGPVVREATKFRDILLAEARQLIARDLIHPGTLGELTGTHGHKNLYLDLVQLIAIFRDNAATVDGWCGVRSDYLDAAETAAARLAKAIGMKEQPMLSPHANLRRRAFSLLSSTYEEARRLITCLRWHEGDYETIAPSFFAGRPTGRRRRPSGQDPEPPSSQAAPRGSVGPTGAREGV